ncbi:MAG: EAL domain-containing protein [Gammaproteobacteria bacterium]|nr:EAL domain-containing protein [Gammaproteobacteria bacterium]
MRLLHIEDDPIDADLIRQALKRSVADLHLDLATSLADARRHLEATATTYDAVLVDLQLPDGSGLELLAEIRNRELPLPVIVLTGSGDQQSAIAALQSGADDYIPKAVESYAHLGASLEGARERFQQRRGLHARSLRILYVEHDAADIDLTLRHLQRHAPYMHVEVAPSAVIALSQLPLTAAYQCDFDILMLDYQLPGINALDAVHTIRNERGLDIPIVIVSGQGSESVAAESIKLGVDAYLGKHPGYLFELIPTLEKVQRQRALMREQAELKRTSEHLSYLLDSSPVVLYTLEWHGSVPVPTWVSSNITRLFGYTVQEALEPGWWVRHLHPDDKQMAIETTARLSTAGAVRHDYRYFDKSGRVHWIRDEIHILSDDGHGRRALGVWHDITERRLLEQVQQTRIATLDTLIEGRELDDILVDLANRLETILVDARVSILLLSRREHRLYTAAAPSLPEFFNHAVDGLEPREGNGSCGTSAATGVPFIVDDVATHPYWETYTALTQQAGVAACWSIPIKDADGGVIGTFGIYHDQPRSPSSDELGLIDEFARIAGLAVQRSRSEARLRQAAAVFDCTREGIVITDLEPRIVAVNKAYTEITGYTDREVLGSNPSILQSGRQDEAFYQSLWASLIGQGYWQGEIWNRRKNGEIYPQLLTISTVHNERAEPKNYVGVMTDISQLKQSEASLERLAHYDPLTGLPNRLLIHSRLEHALQHAQRQQSRVAVLFLDLDRFKNVNDSLGHPVGDDLLQALTRRLNQRLRGDDTFGRLGGDEFLIILDQTERPEDAAKIARELIELLDEPFVLPAGNEIYISASIGISMYPDDGEVASQLIQHADAAMYQAKEQGRNTVRFYTPALTAAVNRRMDLETRMRRGLANNEFVVHYQPQVEISSGRIVACEALVRWNDPEHGLVSPADFIPLAEENGLIIPLGEQVLDAACRQFRHWIDKGLPPFCLSINLSGRQLMKHDIIRQIGNAIERYRLPAERLKFELTESIIMGRGEDATALLAAIKGLGVKLSIDDFGTGYSSLAYLKRFPIDELKIDRSFVRDIPGDSDDAQIAATIIAMAHNLRLKVVAEGVETREQAEFLAAHDCNVYQGFLYSPPVPGDRIEALLAASTAYPEN